MSSDGLVALHGEGAGRMAQGRTFFFIPFDDHSQEYLRIFVFEWFSMWLIRLPSSIENTLKADFSP